MCMMCERFYNIYILKDIILYIKKLLFLYRDGSIYNIIFLYILFILNFRFILKK